MLFHELQYKKKGKKKNRTDTHVLAGAQGVNRSKGGCNTINRSPPSTLARNRSSILPPPHTTPHHRAPPRPSCITNFAAHRYFRHRCANTTTRHHAPPRPPRIITFAVNHFLSPPYTTTCHQILPHAITRQNSLPCASIYPAARHHSCPNTTTRDHSMPTALRRGCRHHAAFCQPRVQKRSEKRKVTSSAILLSEKPPKP